MKITGQQVAYVIFGRVKRYPGINIASSKTYSLSLAASKIGSLVFFHTARRYYLFEPQFIDVSVAAGSFLTCLCSKVVHSLYQLNIYLRLCRQFCVIRVILHTLQILWTVAQSFDIQVVVMTDILMSYRSSVQILLTCQGTHWLLISQAHGLQGLRCGRAVY